MTRDFNELVDPSEKRGGAIRSEDDYLEFRQMLRACGLWEIKHEGYQLSWYGVRNEELVQCRLDRIVANQFWQEMFPQAKALYLKKNCSDHSLLISSLMEEQKKTWGNFRYDQRWLQRDGFKEMVVQSWQDQMSNFQISIMEALSGIKKQSQSGKG